MPDSRQTERPFELINQLGITEVVPQWLPKHRGYHLRKNGKAFGFVRFNIAQRNRGRFTVYSYCHHALDDPKTRFQTVREAQSRFQLHTVVRPDDVEGIRYALRVLRASYERT